MKYKLYLVITVVMFLIPFSGCGVPQEDYEAIKTQFNISQARLGETKTQLSVSQARVSELESEIEELKEQYIIIGENPTETAQNIVKRYHETHIYSKYDFFVCSDMTLDVWDMLKAHGINAIIQIGNVDTPVEGIEDVNHAWILAEVSPASHLALEPTGGYAVLKKDNPLYYRGWSFDNPREYKRYVELKQEYVIRAEIAMQLWEGFEASRQNALEASAEYNYLANQLKGTSILNPSLGSDIAELIMTVEELGEQVGRCDQLQELIDEQMRKLENIVSEMEGLFG